VLVGLPKKFVYWGCLSVAFSVVIVAGRSLAGDAYWTTAIRRGELVIVAATLTASAVGYAAVATVTGRADIAKTIVIGPGIIVLTITIFIYSSFSDPSKNHTVHEVASQSYVLLAVAVVLGSLATFVTHRAGVEAS
jgi:predicted anti-sigma-YlaC factor YlaD